MDAVHSAGARPVERPRGGMSSRGFFISRPVKVASRTRRDQGEIIMVKGIAKAVGGVVAIGIAIFAIRYRGPWLAPFGMALGAWLIAGSLTELVERCGLGRIEVAAAHGDPTRLLRSPGYERFGGCHGDRYSGRRGGRPAGFGRPGRRPASVPQSSSGQPGRTARSG